MKKIIQPILENSHRSDSLSLKQHTAFKKIFNSDINQDLIKDMFWYIVGHGFQLDNSCDGEDANTSRLSQCDSANIAANIDNILSRIARNYVSLMGKRQGSDRLFPVYCDAMCECIHRILKESFPADLERMESDEVKLKLIDIMSEWILGTIKTNPVMYIYTNYYMVHTLMIYFILAPSQKAYNCVLCYVFRCM